eukprot:SM000034S12738  [mRNA]  locus=s34:435986:444507:- [translate_table: standard]
MAAVRCRQRPPAGGISQPPASAAAAAPPPPPVLPRRHGLRLARTLGSMATTPLRDVLGQHGFVLASYQPGTHRLLCPQGRRPFGKHAATVNGSAATHQPEQQTPERNDEVEDQAAAGGRAAPVQLALRLDPLSPEVLAWFAERKITQRTLEASHVGTSRQKWKNKNGVFEERVSVAFPYFREGRLVNCKYRTREKDFRQVKGGEKVLYGLDLIKGAKEIVIVEGEVDKLSMDEAGIPACVSVPDGAPAKALDEDKMPSQDKDKKFEYLWNCRQYLDKASRLPRFEMELLHVSKVVLATDADEAGQALAEELARRLGRERCWRVKFPEKEPGIPFKDANELLVARGPQALRECVASAEPYPIRGLFRFKDFFQEIDNYYYLRLGDERGVSTGWQTLDEMYRVVPGELTVVTGIPNSGKSEWIDALLCNLQRQQGWTFALCSMENKVRDHSRKLLEKYTGSPFFDALYSNGIRRMTPDQLAEGKAWLTDNFVLIRCEDDELPSIDWLLNLAKAAVLRYGIRGLVIDPYNELDHQRPSRQTETEYVSSMLTKVKRFAQHHDCHVWFVAHPKQLQVWKGEAPGLYDISGSAHFVNKCDNGIVIHRNRDKERGPLDHVEVLVRKVRNKAAGTIGDAILRYDSSKNQRATVAQVMAGNVLIRRQYFRNEHMVVIRVVTLVALWHLQKWDGYAVGLQEALSSIEALG